MNRGKTDYQSNLYGEGLLLYKPETTPFQTQPMVSFRYTNDPSLAILVPFPAINLNPRDLQTSAPILAVLRA